jgi:hypothetical protein
MGASKLRHAASLAWPSARWGTFRNSRYNSFARPSVFLQEKYDRRFPEAFDPVCPLAILGVLDHDPTAPHISINLPFDRHLAISPDNVIVH